MTRFSSAAEFLAAGGQCLGVSAWRVVTPVEVGQLVAATGVAAALHSDPPPPGGPFRHPVVPGQLTLALAPSLLAEILSVDGYPLAVGVGFDRVRFPAPTPVGSRVRAHGLLLSAAVVGSALRVVTELSFECDAAPRPVCIAQVVTQLWPG